jgi:hypothetical protein
VLGELARALSSAPDLPFVGTATGAKIRDVRLRPTASSVLADHSDKESDPPPASTPEALHEWPTSALGKEFTPTDPPPKRFPPP